MKKKKFKWYWKTWIKSNFWEYDYLWFLAEVWTIKEDFMDAMDEKNLDKINRIMTDCLASEHYRMKQFWRTLKRWYAWIEGFFSVKSDTFKFTNALTEGINNLCKVVKSYRFHWFRLKNYVFEKISC